MSAYSENCLRWCNQNPSKDKVEVHHCTASQCLLGFNIRSGHRWKVARE